MTAVFPEGSRGELDNALGCEGIADVGPGTSGDVVRLVDEQVTAPASQFRKSVRRIRAERLRGCDDDVARFGKRLGLIARLVVQYPRTAWTAPSCGERKPGVSPMPSLNVSASL